MVALYRTNRRTVQMTTLLEFGVLDFVPAQDYSTEISVPIADHVFRLQQLCHHTRLVMQSAFCIVESRCATINVVVELSFRTLLSES